MKNQKGFTVLELILPIIGLMAVGGWIANIYKLVTTGFELAVWGGLEVARVIGVFIAPLGVVLGYL